MKSIAILILVLSIEFVVYLIFFRPYLLNWGATPGERAMAMQGDKYAETISCTRAVEITRPAAEVWPYVAALGADRRGFYSYEFLERPLGYGTAKIPDLKNIDMPVGRLIPYTKPDAEGNFHDGFKIIESEQGKYFVLQVWGEFRLTETTEGNTRLLVRTHWPNKQGILHRLWTAVFDAGHYIMERRMMLGMKDAAESTGKYDSAAADFFWFLCIVLSGLAGLSLAFISPGYFKLLSPFFFLVIWQFFLLVANPRPIAGALILLIAASFVYANRFLR
ncbi:MAG: hypothetical protein JXA72_02710 [Bacteroidales bacterium]|nr:hypothetical protein [Bacteroidales bacterium]